MKIKLHRKKDRVFALKREWGSEKDMTPLSALHDVPSTRKLVLSRIAIFLTIFFWVLYILSIVLRQLIDNPQGYNFTMEAFAYASVVTFLTLSALLYLISRLGAFERFSKHNRVPHSVLEKHFSKNKTAITVLVPSYNEEPQVVRKTLFSAAIQEFPNKHIVLLVDDNPYPTDQAVLERLNQTRNIAHEIEEVLKVPYTRFKESYNKYISLEKNKKSVSEITIAALSENYKWGSQYLQKISEQEKIDDHVDVFFTEQVLNELAKDLNLVSEALDLSIIEEASLSKDRVDELYQRLLWIFGCKLDVFERKRYVSLSKEANKAMNLNSYIGLMGGTYSQEETPEGIILTPVEKEQKGDLKIPDTEFLLTLDADSILLKDYCMRLSIFFTTTK